MDETFKGATLTRGSEAEELAGADHQDKHRAIKKDWMTLPTDLLSTSDGVRVFP
jgi:hypothetical protein